MTTTLEHVFVTGAAGFIGAALVNGLVELGSDVHAIVRPRTDAHRLADVAANITMHRVDLRDADALRRLFRSTPPAVVHHTAARHGHPQTAAELTALWDDTVRGTVALVESLHGCDVQRLVHMGSSLEYAARARPLREVDPVRPATPRGVTKAAAAMLVRGRAADLGIPLTLLRPFSVYGPHEEPGRIIPTIMRALCTDGALRTTTETFRRDFVHVDDVVDACVHLARCPQAAGATCNIGTGVETSTPEVIELAQRATGRRLAVHEGGFPARPSDARHWVADMSFTRDVMGWSPQIDLADGLRRTFDAYCRVHEACTGAGRAP